MFKFEEIPLPTLPVNVSDGEDVLPAGNCKVPVIVSPAFSTLKEEEPITEAVIVPAEKFPELSLETIVDAVFEEVASVPTVISSVPVTREMCVS